MTTTLKHMIKLALAPGEAVWTHVKNLDGLNALTLDEDFGLVCISSRRRLYTVLAVGEVDRDRLMAAQPRVKGVYGEVKISGITHGKKKMV